MTRTGRELWFRIVAFALLWVLGLAWDGRCANASGCHAPERPTLGLSASWDRDTDLPLVLDPAPRREPRFVPIPCPGETPGRIGVDRSAQPVALPAEGEPLALSSSTSNPVAPTPLEFRLQCTRLDRPPRRSF